jgi:hypothetical protein
MNLQLRSNVLMDLYEQIIYELQEVGEKDTSQNLFKRAVMDLKDQFPDRLAHLDQVVRAKSTLSVIYDYKRVKKPILITILTPTKKKGGNY